MAASRAPGKNPSHVFRRKERNAVCESRFHADVVRNTVEDAHDCANHTPVPLRAFLVPAVRPCALGGSSSRRANSPRSYASAHSAT